jgi:hypothetical protein
MAGDFTMPRSGVATGGDDGLEVIVLACPTNKCKTVVWCIGERDFIFKMVVGDGEEKDEV